MNLEPAFIIAYIAILAVVAYWPWKKPTPSKIQPVAKDITEKVIAHVFTERFSAPRNAPCPCGSGKKFKVCHAA